MDKSSKDKEYNIKFNIEDTKLLIKANNQEEEYINSFSYEDIIKKDPKINCLDDLEEIKEQLEKGEKKVELSNDILKLNLKFELEVYNKKKEINISFDLKKPEIEVYSIEKPELGNDEKDQNNLANELDKNENFGNKSTITKKTDTNMYFSINDLNINEDYNSYKCPDCKKIPKIVFINDNKIMINCCEKYNYSVINIKDFLDILNKNYKKSEKIILKFCENCQNVLCKDCEEKNKVIMWENKISNLFISGIKLDKKNSMNKSEKLKECKENTMNFTDKTDNNNFCKGEPLIGNKNKYSPVLPECNQLINIIIHNSQFYNDSNHLKNLENIFNFKNNKDYEDKNTLIIEYKGNGEEEGISLFGDGFLLKNIDK